MGEKEHQTQTIRMALTVYRVQVYIEFYGTREEQFYFIEPKHTTLNLVRTHPCINYRDQVTPHPSDKATDPTEGGGAGGRRLKWEWNGTLTARSGM